MEVVSCPSDYRLGKVLSWRWFLVPQVTGRGKSYHGGGSVRGERNWVSVGGQQVPVVSFGHPVISPVCESSPAYLEAYV